MFVLEERLQLIKQIDHLNALHPPTKKQRTCIISNCQICAELQQLGVEYESLTLIKRQRKQEIHSQADIIKRKRIILAKGDSATKSEITFLIEVAKMTKRDVSKALGIGESQLLTACKAWGVGQIKPRRVKV